MNREDISKKALFIIAVLLFLILFLGRRFLSCRFFFFIFFGRRWRRRGRRLNNYFSNSICNYIVVPEFLFDIISGNHKVCGIDTAMFYFYSHNGKREIPGNRDGAILFFIIPLIIAI